MGNNEDEDGSSVNDVHCSVPSVAVSSRGRQSKKRKKVLGCITISLSMTTEPDAALSVVAKSITGLALLHE